MASALSALANAAATFKVAGTGVVTDPDTGNVSPAEATVAVELFLRAERVETITYPGIDQTSTIYDGYALAALDSRIVIGTQGTLTFAGEDPVPFEVKALRLSYGGEGLIGETLAAVLGERVQLISRVQS